MADSTSDHDLVVLGAGTGGYAAAFRAAQLGLKVALVDEAKIGGTCLHWGCIPTKALLESAALADRVRHAKQFGIVLPGEPEVDYAAIAARRDAIVGRIWKGLSSLVRKNGVTWVAGRGRLDGPTTVRVALAGEDGTPGAGGEQVLRAKDVIVATGSRVRSLPGLVPDGRRIVTSDDVVRSTTMPASIVIVGAGAVGCEFASFYRDLGAEVTLLEYLPAIVPSEDADVSRELERSFTRRGITVVTSARFDADSVRTGDDGVRITVGPDGGDRAELHAEVLLVAAGRAANVEEIGLETTKAVVDRGFVTVDGYLRTAEPHLWAIGDVVGGLMLAHTAAHEGITAVHAMTGDPDVHPIDHVTQPRATYCRPEIASIGLTERQCADRGIAVKVGRVPFQAIGKALIGGEYEGFTKVIADAATDRIVGVHIVGPHATDLVGEASVAISLDAAPWEVGAATHAHPTLSEIVAEAALAVDGRSINF